MPDSGFPLPTSSYKELIKIIQGYGRIGVDASLSDVAHHTAIGETIISGNNRFLLAIGVISGGKRKAITSLGRDLAHALEHDVAEDIASTWRAIVIGSEFLQKIIAAVRIRKGMDESSLESHVAYSAGQPKTPAVATGAGTVVNILKAAALLKEEGGNLIATVSEPPSIPETVQKSLSIRDHLSLPSDSSEDRPTIISASARMGSVRVNIEVTVQCTPNDLDGLGRKLRAVIKELNEPEGDGQEEA